MAKLDITEALIAGIGKAQEEEKKARTEYNNAHDQAKMAEGYADDLYRAWKLKRFASESWFKLGRIEIDGDLSDYDDSVRYKTDGYGVEEYEHQ